MEEGPRERRFHLSAGPFFHSAMRHPASRLAVVALLALAGWTAAPRSRAASPAAPGLAACVKWHYDAENTGWNWAEAALTPATVNPGGFGKLREYAVDGQLYAQPLYLRNAPLPGGARNLVFAATEHNSVYAFDADGAQSAPVWQVNLGPSVPSNLTGCGLLSPEIGITATPVLAPETNTLYVVAKLLEEGRQVNRIFALDALTGAVLPGWGMELRASVPGVDGGVVTLDNGLQFCRAGLTRRNGRVYVALASHCDIELQNYHGWVLGYNELNPAEPPQAWCATPLSAGTSEAAGGIWMTGASPSLDEHDNLYVVTGNGPMDVDRGQPNVGNSVVKLATQGGAGLLFGGTNADYYTPSNQIQLDQTDTDLGSCGAMLITETKGRATLHAAIAGGKDGVLRVLNRDQLGGFTGRNNPRARDRAFQDLPGFGRFFSSAAYWGSDAGHFVYVNGVGGPLVQYQVKVSGSRLTLAKKASSAARTAYPSATPVVSSNGSARGTGVVWLLNQRDGGLHAYDAARVTRQLYSSVEQGQRDALDSVVKFSVPMVANGRVYMGTNRNLAVFGRLGQ